MKAEVYNDRCFGSGGRWGVNYSQRANMTVNGFLNNEGKIIVHGNLIVNAGVHDEAFNIGTIDCRDGGMIIILE